MIRKRVVVAPLDWGLGHATRCVPIIEELLNRNCEVWIASSGVALKYLKKEFPTLPFIPLVSYRARYSSWLPLMIAVLFQLPKFLWAIGAEHLQMKRIVKENKIDLIISDNRFGCWSRQTPCVFITHQVSIQMPAWLRWMQPFFNFFNHQFIKRFTFCWIPDADGEKNLTGVLSKTSSIPVRYIGILSRFATKVSGNHKKDSAMYDLAVILSGPEPQRTVLENLIRLQLNQVSLKIILVRGLVELITHKSEEEDLTIVNFLSGQELKEVIEHSKVILCRSGYSTLMDLAVLEKKAILIPTPGQTEQEYLAERLLQEKICFSMSQKDFNLKYALDQSQGFSGFSNIELSSKSLTQVLDEALAL